MKPNLLQPVRVYVISLPTILAKYNVVGDFEDINIICNRDSIERHSHESEFKMVKYISLPPATSQLI